MRTSSMPSSTPSIAHNANNREQSDADDYRLDTELSKYLRKNFGILPKLFSKDVSLMSLKGKAIISYRKSKKSFGGDS